VAHWRKALYAWLEEIRFRTGIAVVVGVLAIAGGVIAALVTLTSGASAQPSRSLTHPAPAALPQLAAGSDLAPPTSPTIPSTSAKPTASKPFSQPNHNMAASQGSSLASAGRTSTHPDPASSIGPGQRRANPWGSGGWGNGHWPQWTGGGHPWPGHGGWHPKGGWPTGGWKPSRHQSPGQSQSGQSLWGQSQSGQHHGWR
jgi:hypothetical protein